MESTAAARSHDPVTFASPPVNEVMLSVQFEAEVIDEVGTLARYWPTVNSDFPGLEKQPPLPPVHEDFAHPPSAPGPQFQLLQAPPTMRYWFVSGSRALLIQVQPNRFGLNWRQVPEGGAYPRFRTLRPEFEQRYRAFCELAAEAGNPAPAPQWCELAYVNHVESHGDRPDTHGPLSRVLRALNPGPTSAVLPAVEDTQLQQRFLIPDPATSDPLGRLYLAATPGFRSTDSVPVYVVTLVARGRAPERSTEGVLSFFDLAHDLIVRGFKESTTDEMHNLWGLEE